YLETTRLAHPIASAFRADWPAVERPCVRWSRRIRRASVQQIRPDRSPMPASVEQAYLRRRLLQPVFSRAYALHSLLRLLSGVPTPAWRSFLFAADRSRIARASWRQCPAFCPCKESPRAPPRASLAATMIEKPEPGEQSLSAPKQWRSRAQQHVQASLRRHARPVRSTPANSGPAH